MKRNIHVTFQVSFESNLSDEELKNNITDSVIKTMTSVKDAEPEGLYLITIEPGPDHNFPRVPSSDKFTSDLQMDRRREFEKELKQEEMWRNQG